MKEPIEALRNVTELQCSNGNWDYDPYMHGMANGLLLAQHIMTKAEGEVPYKDAPEVWLSDRPSRSEVASS